MTVDSFYYPQVFVNDGDTEYTVDIESVGDVAIDVYKVAGAVRTLLTPDFHYTLEFEEHLDPIFTRVKILLAAPLSADGHLEVFRKTPIATTYEEIAGEPFRTEQLEYAMDKICYIQQEIEGHACGCPPYPDYPDTPDVPPENPDPPPDLPPCKIYECDAFIEASKTMAAFVWPAHTKTEAGSPDYLEHWDGNVANRMPVQNTSIITPPTWDGAENVPDWCDPSFISFPNSNSETWFLNRLDVFPEGKGTQWGICTPLTTDRGAGMWNVLSFSNSSGGIQNVAPRLNIGRRSDQTGVRFNVESWGTGGSEYTDWFDWADLNVPLGPGTWPLFVLWDFEVSFGVGDNWSITYNAYANNVLVYTKTYNSTHTNPPFSYSDAAKLLHNIKFVRYGYWANLAASNEILTSEQRATLYDAYIRNMAGYVDPLAPDQCIP